MKLLNRFFFAIFMCGIASSALSAQDLANPLDPNALRGAGANQGIYILTDRNDLSTMAIAIKVMGNVPRSGLYIVRKGMRLDDMLGLAGGPVLSQRRKQDTNTVSVLLSRKTGSGRVVIYNELWDNMISSPEEFPTMQDGDIIEVRTVTETGFGRTELVQIGVQAGFTVVGILVQILFYSLNRNN